ncbi:MAG: UvrD-helicase domain-containing protein [Ginsengibacter sp.]
MKLTSEQDAIINSSGNIKINAVAGSGKTTTIIEYAKARPAHSRILYLAFNKSVKIEASKRFHEKGLANVQVETAHSLAYKNIVFKNHYKVRSQGYKTNEITEILNLKGNGDKITEYVIANHINKFIAYFCNSDKQKVKDLNYLDVVSDGKAKTFVKTFYSYIEKQSRLFLNKMDKGEIEITHDFYLKKFHLSNPLLNFDFILFDEGQDASPAMLDIFLKQTAIKVIVGDTHQQIYGWRFAVNSLEKATFKTLNLSASFRFSQPVADLAIAILERKKIIGKHETVKITGNADTKEIKTKAVLARTNLGLLLKAIEYVTENKKPKKIYFEGNINSYTYADDGASLYDVLNLYNGNRTRIKDKLIQSMKNMYELEDYTKKTEDAQLSMMVEIVKEYGNKIPGIIKSIKENHIDNDDKENAEMIFSTVHRCKGMEYDSVQLVNDFVTEEKLNNLKKESKEKELNISKLNEEINLLYVAITRTKNTIYIPETLMPVDFPVSTQIHILKEIPIEISLEESSINNLRVIKEKSWSVAEAREKNKQQYMPWTPELDQELTEMYCNGIHEKDLCKHFGRSRSAIKARIKKLELYDLYG